MAGPFDFLHIKGRTAGSSNELSFDVLDAARQEIDEKRKANRIARASTAPRPSQGSYSGVAGTSTLSAVPEVERRKRVRRARAVRMRVFVVTALAAFLAVGAFAGYRLYEEKVDFTSRVSTLISQFVNLDKAIVEVDALMGDPLNSVEREARDQALAGFPGLEGELDAVIEEASRMSVDAANDNDRAALSEIEDAARARKDMLAAAADVFKLSEIVNRQAVEAVDAWNLVLAGDAMAREATTMANSATTEEATLEARRRTEEAIGKLTSARSQLSVIERGASGLGFADSLAYIDKRIESLEAALKTADALLANDRASAVASNDIYNSADREAAALASALPASMGDQVKAQYADEVARKKSDYASARVEAASADSVLRSYLPD